MSKFSRVLAAVVVIGIIAVAAAVWFVRGPSPLAFAPGSRYEHVPGYDFVIQAMSGLMSITGEADGPPQKVGVAVVDVLAGLFAATSLLAALYERRATGRGIGIDVE